MESFTSLLDCLLRGLQLANNKTFLYRVVYVGQHKYQSVIKLYEYFKDNIQKCNSAYCDEHLTGFLLVYDGLLIHMVEGSEESITNHFQMLCNDMDSESVEYSNLRVLIVWPHVPSRKASEWFAFKGEPNESDIVITSTCQASPFVQQCLNNMCRLTEILDQPGKGHQGKQDEVRVKTLETIPNELVGKLPEAGQVLFLTTCSVLLSVHSMQESIRNIPRIPYSVLRLGRFLDSLYSALSTIHHADIVVRVTLTLSKIASALFLLADHILWFGRTGLVVVDSTRWSAISYKYWLYSLTMNLVRDVYEIWRGLTRQVDKRSLRLGNPSRSYQCSIDTVCPISAIKVIFAFLSEHQDIAVDTVKNACDILIPLTALGYTKFSPGAIGVLGVVSSIAAILSLVDPTKKLSPS